MREKPKLLTVEDLDAAPEVWAKYPELYTPWKEGVQALQRFADQVEQYQGGDDSHLKLARAEVRASLDGRIAALEEIKHKSLTKALANKPEAEA